MAKSFVTTRGRKTVDVRIGWDTYIVTWDKQPIGFLSGELK